MKVVSIDSGGAQVSEGSPAFSAGMRVGDQVLRFGAVDAALVAARVLKAHRLVYHSLLGLRAIKKKKRDAGGGSVLAVRACGRCPRRRAGTSRVDLMRH